MHRVGVRKSASEIYPCHCLPSRKEFVFVGTERQGRFEKHDSPLVDFYIEGCHLADAFLERYEVRRRVM